MKTISIITPVLNESGLVAPFLRHLLDRVHGTEIVVVDGGSSDETRELARPLCDQLVQSRAGRAVQMNAGARRSNGDVLWFLHVDAEVPKGALNQIERALQDRHVVGGFFRIRIPNKSFVYRFTDVFAHYAGLLLRIRFGDHGFFCRRDVFEKIGGFPEVPIMEDADFFRSLRRAGKTVVIPRVLVVSPRRYEKIGPMRLTFVFGVISLFYFFRLPRPVLQSIYRRTCC